MEPQLEQIREQQKQSWNKFSPGWKKWDKFNMEFLRPMGEAIIRHLDLQNDDRVLDIASGTGEPGLTIAKLVPNGKVTAIDLSEDMLVIAAENAGAKGLKNFETLVADVSELPFETQAFDAISCRMGFMFFPDMQLAVKEMLRILKPGGRIAVAVWAGAELNNWVTTSMSVIQKHVAMPKPLPGAPGMFRCGKPDMIADLFKQAGFQKVEEEEITGKVDYQSFERYWEIMLDVGAPIVAALSQANEATKATIKAEAADLFQSKNEDGNSILNYGALIIYGEK